MRYELISINELCERITDGAHNSPAECFEKESYPMYSSKDMLYGGFDDSDVKRISFHDYEKFVAQDCQPKINDILIIKDGANFLKYAFKVAEKINAVILSSIAILRPNTSIIDPDYFTYVLRTTSIKNAMSNYVSGAAIPRIVLKDFKKMKLRIEPSIESQQTIVRYLLPLDCLIEINNKRIKVLEQMAENLYKEWFVRFRFPGHESVPFENGLPQGWSLRRGDEVIAFNPALALKEQTQFTIIPMEALSTSSMVLDSSCFVTQDSISGRRSQNGDTLLAKITPCLENGKTGFVMGMPDGEVFGGSTEFVVLRSKTLNPYYVYCLARSYYFRQTAILSMNGADGRQRVDEDKLKSMKIIQPSKAVLNQFETVMSPIFDTVHKMVQSNHYLTKQRDLLLPRLMSGKLEV